VYVSFNVASLKKNQRFLHGIASELAVNKKREDAKKVEKKGEASGRMA